jgi:hypothetical protein
MTERNPETPEQPPAAELPSSECVRCRLPADPDRGELTEGRDGKLRHQICHALEGTAPLQPQPETKITEWKFP